MFKMTDLSPNFDSPFLDLTFRDLGLSLNLEFGQLAGKNLELILPSGYVDMELYRIVAKNLLHVSSQSIIIM